MDLRDRFAASLAAALVDAFSEPDEIARRAYELAEAMIRERARRIDHDEARHSAPALLDAPMPDLEEDERDFEPPYDPTWDLDERPLPATQSRPPGPGLARTQPEAADEREERSA